MTTRFVREFWKGIRLKFFNWDMPADNIVRESGDIGEGLRKSYIFCLTTHSP